MMRAGEAVIDSLLELSARIGRDPLLVQASTGNTSIKVGGVLWIKASGKWLANADREEILVSLDLAGARECVKENRTFESLADSPGSLSQPSIETAMHAVLPQAVVLHVHSVNAIAWAVRRDAPNRLKEQLSGLPWQWLPYTPSGMALARSVSKALSRHPQTDIFILGNHGLVVCGESCKAAEALLSEVEQRLAIVRRRAPEADLATLSLIMDYSDWVLPRDAALHALGTDPISRSILSGGMLYPCHGIFLRGGRRSSFASSDTEAPPFLVVPRCGVLIDKSMTRPEYAMLTGLVEVVQRIDASAPIRYLRGAEIATVFNADSHSYRKLAENNAQTTASLSAVSQQ